MANGEPTCTSVRGSAPAPGSRRITPAALWVAPAIVAFCIVFWCWCNAFLKSAPPDLDGCTRVEIRWAPSLLEYCFKGLGAKNVQQMLSPSEEEDLKSIEVFVIDDPRRIEAFAQKVGEGRFRGRPGSPTRRAAWSLAGPPFVRIRCYRGSEELVSLTLSRTGTEMVTKDMRRFAYRAVWDYWQIIEPPEIRASQGSALKIEIRTGRGTELLCIEHRKIPKR